MRRIATLLFLLLAPALTFAQDNDLAPPDPAVATWNQLLPDVSAALGAQPNCPAPVIADAAQFAGGPSVALVKPCPVGDRADQIVALVLNNGKPALAQFRDPSGNLMAPKLERSKSPLKPRAVELDPRHNDLLTSAQNRDDHNQFLGCIAAVYTWNRKTQSFNWNTGKSKKQFSDYCGH